MLTMEKTADYVKDWVAAFESKDRALLVSLVASKFPSSSCELAHAALGKTTFARIYHAFCSAEYAARYLAQFRMTVAIDST